MASKRRRSEGFSLETALADPAFTPRGKDLPALVDLLAAEETADAAERGLLRLGPPVAAELVERARAAVAPLRGRLVKALGLLATGGAELTAELLTFSHDDEAKARRNAIIALGKLDAPGVEDRLVALAVAPDTSPPDRRSAVDALGKSGGPAALAALARVPASGDDAELTRLLARARVRLGRTRTRDEAPGAIDAAARPARPLEVHLECRSGLEELLCAELPGARILGPGRVGATLRGSLADLYRARLFLDFGFPIPGASATEALVSDEALTIFKTFTRGPVRYRLDFIDQGPRRAEVLRVALEVAARHPELVNDPTGSTWEARVTERRGVTAVTLVPRLPDPRFAYRRADVPAASHPTIAAALARLAGARATDVVWDPFMGSGTELIERARLGPYRSLHGTDLDARAMAAAAQNLEAAGVKATLEQRDALLGPPPGTTLVITNPPLGRRLLRSRGAASHLLTRLLEVAAPAGARIAWVSPSPEETAAHATRTGYRVEVRRPVDLGGFTAELQLLQPLATSRSRPSPSASPRSRG